MSDLMKKIKDLNSKAARELERAGLDTDSDLRSLTREELHELFPGSENLKLRRDIFEKVHEKKPVDVLIRKLKLFISQDSSRAALFSSGVLADYLDIMKEMKAEMNHVQSFLDTHIGLLEELIKNQPDQESDKGPLSGTSTSGTADPLNGQPEGTLLPGTSGQMVPCTGPAVGYSHGTQSTSDSPKVSCTGPAVGYSHGTQSTSDSPKVFCTGSYQKGSQRGPSKQSPQFVRATVKYQVVISGKTFGAHVQLMDKVKGQAPNQVQFIESSEDGQVTIVFCPICSRIGSDVEAAITDVKGDKPVILVLMHHSREVKTTTSMRTWKQCAQVVLHVNVFYHETARGLLQCDKNNHAASEIGNELLKYKEDTSGNAMGVGAETGSTPNGNNRGSGIGSVWSILPWNK